MLFSNITILDEELNVKENQYVLIKDDRVAYIGDERPQEVSDREIDGKGRLLMSGFFNAHAHSPMTLMRGYGENMVLQDWLTKKTVSYTHLDVYKRQVTDDAVEAIAEQALERKTGARGLRGIMEKIMNNIMYELPSRDDVNKCIITRETVEAEKDPELVLTEPGLAKEKEAKAETA